MSSLYMCVTVVAAAASAGKAATPMTPAEAVKHLNQEYMGYNMATGDGPVGVTVTFVGQPDSFQHNLFCKPFGTRLPNGNRTGCLNGMCDCRMSAALYNWKMMSKDYVPVTPFGRAVGVVFNQTMVEEVFGKCSYIYDGASFNRLNGGCGQGVGGGCNDNHSAWANICPSTGRVCTANDTEVKAAQCAPFGPSALPDMPTGAQCYFSGPALDYPKKGALNHLREMAAARLKVEIKTNDYSDWNEVVIDERVLIPTLKKDPLTAIPAFIYSKSQVQAQNARVLAENFRDTFCKDHNVSDQIPVVGMNDLSDFRPNGPFFVPVGDEDYQDSVTQVLV